MPQKHIFQSNSRRGERSEVKQVQYVIYELQSQGSRSLSPYFKSARAYAEERQSQRVKIAYCGSIKWARPMEVKRWPKQVLGEGFMDYRYKEEDYLVRHQGEQPPPTIIGGALECIRQAADMLAKRQGYTPECIVVENRW